MVFIKRPRVEAEAPSRLKTVAKPAIKKRVEVKRRRRIFEKFRPYISLNVKPEIAEK